MHAFVVIPCLNEQDGLAATCQSLGFPQAPPSNTKLVLVDNGSSDKTLEVMIEIRDAAQPGEVVVVKESNQGYVPARHAGAMAVREAAITSGLNADQVLLLQADADTIYLPDYVSCMCLAAVRAPPMMMLEGAAITAREFARRYPQYDAISREVDIAMQPLLTDDSDDLVLDDKVCGFWLGDYFAWGGHQREFDSSGDELFAETTRLYMRARDSHGARRFRVNDAAALPSRRKLLENPAAHFASAGFPRQRRWFANWTRNYSGRNARCFLERPSDAAALPDFIKYRQRHELALFGLLPLIANAQASCAEATKKLFLSLNLDYCTEPAVALDLVLQLADEQGGPLDAFICKEIAPG